MKAAVLGRDCESFCTLRQKLLQRVQSLCFDCERLITRRQRLIADLKTKLKGLKLKRDKADDALSKVFVLIAHGIRGNEAYGEDCQFYRSLGFVPKSERKTGTIRKKKEEKPTTAPAESEADAA